jgi:hypothetical protein
MPPRDFFAKMGGMANFDDFPTVRLPCFFNGRLMRLGCGMACLAFGSELALASFGWVGAECGPLFFWDAFIAEEPVCCVHDDWGEPYAAA